MFLYQGNPSDLDYLNGFIKRMVGNYCYVSSVPRNKDDFVGIGLVREEVVKDEYEDSVKLFLRDYNDVYKAYFLEGDFGLQLVLPSSEEVHDKFIQKIDRMTYRSEECIMESIGAKILKIPMVRTQMNPLFAIVNYVAVNGSLVMNSRHFGNKSKKLQNYSNFLSSLGIVKIDGNEVYPGEAIDKNLETWDSDSAVDVISSKIKHKELMKLYSDFRFQNMLPFIRLSNINCLSSYYDDKPLNWTPSMFNSNLSNYYHDGSNVPINTLTHALDLKKAGVFESKKGKSGMTFSCAPVYDEYRTALHNDRNSIFA